MARPAAVFQRAMEMSLGKIILRMAIEAQFFGCPLEKSGGIRVVRLVTREAFTLAGRGVHRLLLARIPE
jgi:hypothetical protein